MYFSVEIVSVEQSAANLVQNRSETSLKLGHGQSDTINKLGPGQSDTTNKLGQGQSETNLQLVQGQSETTKLGQGEIMEKLIEEEEMFAVFEEPEERLLPITINCENLLKKQVHE